MGESLAKESESEVSYASGLFWGNRLEMDFSLTICGWLFCVFPLCLCVCEGGIHFSSRFCGRFSIYGMKWSSHTKGKWIRFFCVVFFMVDPACKENEFKPVSASAMFLNLLQIKHKSVSTIKQSNSNSRQYKPAEHKRIPDQHLFHLSILTLIHQVWLQKVAYVT